MVKELTKDNLYFEASEMGFYLENYACTEITFGFSGKGNRKEIQRKVFDLCSEYGYIEQITFSNHHVIVRFESAF